MNNKIKDFYKEYKRGIKDILSVIVVLILLIASMNITFEIGYDRGQDEIQRPEYDIQINTLRVNTTMYNESYYYLTRNDMHSDNWLLDIEPRDDYFIVGIHIVAKSNNWSRFYVIFGIDGFATNITIELISVTRYFSSGGQYIYNWYDGAYGGTLCNERANIYFLGYGGVYADIGESTSNSISITGYYE